MTEAESYWKASRLENGRWFDSEPTPEFDEAWSESLDHLARQANRGLVEPGVLRTAFEASQKTLGHDYRMRLPSGTHYQFTRFGARPEGEDVSDLATIDVRGPDDATISYRPTLRGIWIPEDRALPVTEVRVASSRHASALLRGTAEETRYDHDAVMLVTDDGRIRGDGPNDRANDYVYEHSVSAQQGRLESVRGGSYGLYGDVLVLGSRGPDRTEDAPRRLDALLKVDQAESQAQHRRIGYRP